MMPNAKNSATSWPIAFMSSMQRLRVTLMECCSLLASGAIQAKSSRGITAIHGEDVANFQMYGCMNATEAKVWEHCFFVLLKPKLLLAAACGWFSRHTAFSP